MNDYEYQVLRERAGMDGSEIARQVKAFMVTLGGEGSVLYQDGEEHQIKSTGAVDIKDPTGCGDA